MPKPSFKAHVEGMGTPDVSHLQLLANTYDVSREAATNRYVELSPEMCAFVFAKDGRVRYPQPTKDFPVMSIRAGDPVPQLVPRDSLGLVTASDWLRPTWSGRPPVVLAQQIDQSDGHATVLLHIEADEFEDAAEEDELVASYTQRFRH